jgi:hypothetical protein
VDVTHQPPSNDPIDRPLSPAAADYVARLLAEAPPLTAHQRHIIAAAFSTTTRVVHHPEVGAA